MRHTRYPLPPRLRKRALRIAAGIHSRSQCCIWYPETAAEETYRALAARYPQMKYLVGGACAVAGYVNLFHELDLLPESHIVEEARDNQQWEIYEAIMKPELRYNAMDDCTRTVFDKPVRGGLNGDTAVRSYLEIKTKFAKPPDSDAEIGDLLSFRRRAYFDITEDDWVDESPRSRGLSRTMSATFSTRICPPTCRPWTKTS